MAFVDVALKYPNVGVDVATIFPEASVESTELTAVEIVFCFALSDVCRSVPLSESVPKYPLVVEAVMNDEYEVEEEYANVWRAVQVLALAIFKLKALPLYESPVPAVVVAPDETRPPNTASPPLLSDERWKSPDIVDDAVEKKPDSPSMVEVELYPVLTVNGNECERTVMGEEPMIVACVHDEPPEHERVVVATEARVLAPVTYVN